MSSPSTGTTRFEYDGDRLLQEYDGGGTLLRVYAHGQGSDEPLIVYEQLGGLGRRFLHADHQGSIIALADQNGGLVGINSYDPWGVPGANNQGRFGYTGQAWLPELGMYYYKARIYWPMLGRFLQADPVGYEGGINLYAYAENDPVNNSDPNGHAPADAARWAYNQRGSRTYREDSPEPRVGGFWARAWIFGNGGVGAPKCNFFVYDALRAGGVAPGKVNGRDEIPTAGRHWSNRATQIEHYRALGPDETPQVGDVVANAGHVGIVVGAPWARRTGNADGDAAQMRGFISASAADRDNGDRVKVNGFGFRPKDHLEQVVVWRYVPEVPRQ